MRTTGTARVAVLVLALVPAAGGAAPVAGADRGWTLVWSDEFDGDRIDATKWSHDVDCWGGGNKERQCYTDAMANAAVGDGVLTITALRQRTRGAALPAHLRDHTATPPAMTKKPFSSARLHTRGKGDWRFGRIVVRARLPEGQGTWPAIWMLPSAPHYGRWAASGEIDIMEAVNLGTRVSGCAGCREDHVLGTLHFGGEWPHNAHRGTETNLPPSPDGFHVFAIEWSAGRIGWSVDGRVYQVQTTPDWTMPTAHDVPPAGAPFDRPFHLILNLAIGGGLAEGRNLGGVSEAGFPKRLTIDWVRVYRCAADPDTGRACEARQAVD